MCKSSFGKAVLAVIAAATLTGCGDKDKPAKSDMALPVTAPMQARERLLTDMKKQQADAQRRNDEFEQALGK